MLHELLPTGVRAEPVVRENCVNLNAIHIYTMRKYNQFFQHMNVPLFKFARFSCPFHFKCARIRLPFALFNFCAFFVRSVVWLTLRAFYANINMYSVS